MQTKFLKQSNTIFVNNFFVLFAEADDN